jgi:hypothetical protein
MGKIKKPGLPEAQHMQLDHGFRNSTSHYFRMCCRAILLKADSLFSVKAGEQTDMSLMSVNVRTKCFRSEGNWIRPQDYISTDTLFYITNRALHAVGKKLFIKYSHYVA